jgi:hypothetical protein
VSSVGTVRQEAYNQLQRAVRDGTVTRLDTCELCGRPIGSYYPQMSRNAHHEDYSRPADVIWLCNSCHGRVHRVHRGLVFYTKWLRAQLAGAERLLEREQARQQGAGGNAS